MAYGPIMCRGTRSGEMINVRHFPEAATQTFKEGAPLTLSSGNLAAQAAPIAATIYGVAAEAGKNLTTAGTTEPAISQQTPVNMPSAKVIPFGARVKEGYSMVYLADGENIFSASLVSGVSFSQAFVSSTRYALTLDATTGRYYIDTADSGIDADHCVNILGPDTSMDDSSTDWVLFQFAAATRAF